MVQSWLRNSKIADKKISLAKETFFKHTPFKLEYFWNLLKQCLFSRINFGNITNNLHIRCKFVTVRVIQRRIQKTVKHNLRWSFLLKAFNYFRIELHRRCLTGFGIHLSEVQVLESGQSLGQLTFTCSKSTIEKPGKGVNMFKVNSKNTRTASLTSFWCVHC